MGIIRFILALWAAKLLKPILRITKHNGTNFPGSLALRICPDFLKYVGKPKKIIAVTGTNGKTTVANLICDILELRGMRVLNNRSGSNINSGIATSLLSGCTVFNRSKFDIAVLEVDERSSLRIYPYVRPNILVVTNLFRDSIMRNAHPQYIADILTSSIPDNTELILNGDDLLSLSIAPGNPRKYFGIEQLPTDVTECVNLINDVRICPHCSGQLHYEYLRYHHIGKAYCAECGFHSPAYDYTASSVDTEAMRMTVSDSGGGGDYTLLSNSVFNIYNMVTVITLLRELGLSHEEIGSCMERVSIVGTRYLAEDVGDVKLVMQMAKEKNALACSRVFDYVSSQSGDKELFLMMNCLGDVKHWSENVCWLYDCDFEFLSRDNITHIVATGARAKDYRLRLLLAGVPDEKIDCVHDEFEATEYLHFALGESVYIFYGTDSLALAFHVREKVVKLAKEASYEN